MFEDAINNILFTDGIKKLKYKIYKPKHDAGSSQTSPGSPCVTSFSPSADAWKYRMHLEFTIQGSYYTGQSTEYAYVAGHKNRYCVTAVRHNTSTYYWDIRVTYGGSDYYLCGSGTKLIGSGSFVIVDIDPVGGKIFMSSDYHLYNNTSVTGHVEKTIDITASTSTSNVDLTYMYAATDGSSSIINSYLTLTWDAFKLYDEHDNLLVDAVYAYLITTQSVVPKYAINLVTGEIKGIASYYGEGDPIALVTDFSQVRRDIELYTALRYGEGIKEISVNGWIEAGTRRNALHKLLFAENVSMIKGENGTVLLTALTNNTVGSIAEENTYDDSQEESGASAKTISVTEHLFVENGTQQTVYDNSDGILISGEYIAKFDHAPIYGTPVGSGITIVDYNCNVAIVTGRGTITGTPYTHYTNVIQSSNSNDAKGTDVSVSDVALITGLNSDNIVNKLKAFYFGATKTIKNSFLYNGERCGVKYAFKTLFSDSNNAFLTDANLRVSSIVKATCKFISGYIAPTGSGYADYAIRTYDETWEVPETVHEEEYPTVRLNIIGKGYEGAAGSNGESGGRASEGIDVSPVGADGGAGGAAGSGGAGGYIYTLSIDATNVYSIRVSDDGYNTIVDTYDDEDTLVNSYSSASGVQNDEGFINVFTGTVYARRGLNGVAGGRGGKGGSSDRYSTERMPENGENVGVYTGGTSHTRKVYSYGTADKNWFDYSSFGGGGGAAYGNNGGNSEITGQIDSAVYTKGGNGADAVVPQNVYTEYGSGGFGGNGGGGGGGAGTRWRLTRQDDVETQRTYSQSPGAGGNGSSGTPGIDGCVIIYY